MAVRLGGRAIREIRTLFDSGVIGSWSDKQLLAQFSTGGEGSEAALRVLINRHAPMVMGICRRVLGNEAAAEDAFQATFLVLVRKADSLGSYEMLANWIYGVALRVAKKDRAKTARRRVVERQAAHSRPGWRSEEFEQAELRSVIDDAIASLPERFRVPVILCYLEGLRHEEIAQRLGCPIGTVESRLSRARNQLRSRLARRGLSPLDSTLAVALGPPQALSPVAFVGITERTVEAAGKLSSEKIGGMATLMRWLISNPVGMGPAVQAGVIVSTLVLCAGLVAARLSVSGASGQPLLPGPGAEANLPNFNPANGELAAKAVQEQGQQTNSKVPTSFILNSREEAERKAVTRLSGRTSAIPDTSAESARMLRREQWHRATPKSRKRRMPSRFRPSWPDHVTTRHSSRRASQPLLRLRFPALRSMVNSTTGRSRLRATRLTNCSSSAVSALVGWQTRIWRQVPI